MEHVGYHIVYDQQFDISQTDFDQNVIAMRNAGVKILFIEQMPQNYAAAVIKAMNLQDFHPLLVLGDPTYSEGLVPNAGGADAVDGAYLEQFFACTSVRTPTRSLRSTPSSLGFRTSRLDSSPTSSPSSDGCPASCSPRRSVRPVLIRAGARFFRHYEGSPRSAVATSWGGQTLRRKRQPAVTSSLGSLTASSSVSTTHQWTVPLTGTAATSPSITFRPNRLVPNRYGRPYRPAGARVIRSIDEWPLAYREASDTLRR